MERTGSSSSTYSMEENHEGSSLWRAFASSIADEYASAMVFLRLICLHVESFLASAIAIASPCFYYYYQLDGKMLAFSLSWTMVLH